MKNLEKYLEEEVRDLQSDIEEIEAMTEEEKIFVFRDHTEYLRVCRK